MEFSKGSVMWLISGGEPHVAKSSDFRYSLWNLFRISHSRAHFHRWLLAILTGEETNMHTCVRTAMAIIGTPRFVPYTNQWLAPQRFTFKLLIWAVIFNLGLCLALDTTYSVLVQWFWLHTNFYSVNHPVCVCSHSAKSWLHLNTDVQKSFAIWVN